MVSTVDLLVLTILYYLHLTLKTNIFLFFNEEANCIEPSPSLRVTWSLHLVSVVEANIAEKRKMSRQYTWGNFYKSVSFENLESPK
jgi:hypothetical protein